MDAKQKQDQINYNICMNHYGHLNHNGDPIPRTSIHDWGIAIDMASNHQSPEYWRKAATYFSRPSQHDRIVSMMMLMVSTRSEMNKHLGISQSFETQVCNISKYYGANVIEEKETTWLSNYCKLMDSISGRIARNSIYGIRDNTLLNELLNYKPKTTTMKFKNTKFAVKGDIIELLKFEKELIKLGYASLYDDVFNYRSFDSRPALYITVGSHFGCYEHGKYLPAMNEGSSPIIFSLPVEWDKAVKYASEREPLFVTQDGVKIHDTQVRIFGLKKRPDNSLIKDRKDDYRGYEIISLYFSCQLDKSYLWFSSKEAVKAHVDKNVPVLITEDGVPKFAGDTVWYVRKDFSYHFWRSGLKTPVNENILNNNKFFNEEATAVEYIKRNKPLFHFSQNELESFLSNIPTLKNTPIKVDIIDFPEDFVKKD